MDKTDLLLFKGFQSEIVELSNSNEGRSFLGISHELTRGEKIHALAPNAYFIKLADNKYRAVFRTYNLFSDRLSLILTKSLLNEEQSLYKHLDSLEGILHYADIKKTYNKYPEYLFDTGSYYSTAGDGSVERQAATTWNDARNSATGALTGTATTARVGVHGDTGGFGWYVARGFFPFNTANIGAEIKVSSGTFKAVIDSKQVNDNDGLDYLSLIQTSQDSISTLANTDFDNITLNNPDKGANDIDISSSGTGNYLTWTLNSNGLEWVDGENGTRLGLREGHDLENNTPAPDWTYALMRTSEYAGTTSDPLLDITFKIVRSASMFLVF